MFNISRKVQKRPYNRLFAIYFVIGRLYYDKN